MHINEQAPKGIVFLWEIYVLLSGLAISLVSAAVPMGKPSRRHRNGIYLLIPGLSKIKGVKKPANG